jgi:hypothetical protein
MGLIDLLPDYYINSQEVIELQGAFEHWTEALKAAREDLFLQFNVESATWGLSIWEKALGLETNASKSYEFRRTRIMSKLRGSGTTTTAMIQNVAESFSNGEVTIIEYNNENRFEVKFTGTIGIPPNMDDLTAAMEEIKPAHLAYSYVYIYRTNGTLVGYTHGQLAAYTHETLREGAM